MRGSGHGAWIRVAACAALLVAGGPAAAGADEGDGGPVLDAYHRKIVVLDPFPAGVAHPAHVALGGRLLGGYRSPQVAVVRPNGRAEYVPAAAWTVSGSRFSAALPLDGGRGVYRIELVATSPGNSVQTAARLRLFVGVPVVRGEEPMPPETGDDLATPTVLLERRVAAQIDAMRRTAGVEPTSGCEPLAALARAHAAANAARGTADHRPDAAGDLAARATAQYRWQDLRYALPTAPPAPGPGATSYVTALVDGAKSVDQALARWKRNAAHVVPLVNPHVTHVAVGIAPAKNAFVVVVALAQWNGDAIAKDVETRWATLLDDYRSAPTVAVRLALLREMALWGRRESRREAAKHADADDPGLRAAAWDAKSVLDEAETRREAEGLVRRMEADAREGRPSSALAATEWMSRCAWAPFLAAPAAAARERLEAQATAALAAADALAKEGKAAEARAAYDALAATYPGTVAGGEAGKRPR